MQTSLIVIRGNSGSGKSTTARAVRDAYGQRGIALVSQDVVRREMLRELDVAGGVNIDLLAIICRHTLEHGHHVILEGILAASRYASMLTDVRAQHAGTSAFFYLDIPWEETLRRHDTRPQKTLFTPEQMRQWYRERDLLPDGQEQIIGPDVSLQAATQLILQSAGLIPVRLNG